MPSLKRIPGNGRGGVFSVPTSASGWWPRGTTSFALDNFFTSQKSNVAHLLSQSNFELIRHDVTLPIFLEVDEIYNLACPARPPGHYQYNPIKTMKTSVMGGDQRAGHGQNAAGRRCSRPRPARSMATRKSTLSPSPTAARSIRSAPRACCYDEGKRAAETLFMDYHRSNRVNIPRRADFQHVRPAHCTPSTAA